MSIEQRNDLRVPSVDRPTVSAIRSGTPVDARRSEVAERLGAAFRRAAEARKCLQNGIVRLSAMGA
jgi:hypothetical protein